jgi:hypothetical protein
LAIAVARFVGVALLLACIFSFLARLFLPDIMDDPAQSTARIGVALWGAAAAVSGLDTWQWLRRSR